jgi:6-phosphofructokinase 1
VIKKLPQLNLDCLVVPSVTAPIPPATFSLKEGLNVVGLPKTIDNDIVGTDVTFGSHSAVSIATEAIDRCTPPPTAITRHGD